MKMTKSIKWRVGLDIYRELETVPRKRVGGLWDLEMIEKNQAIMVKDTILGKILEIKAMQSKKLVNNTTNKWRIWIKIIKIGR